MKDNSLMIKHIEYVDERRALLLMQLENLDLFPNGLRKCSKCMEIKSCTDFSMSILTRGETICKKCKAIRTLANKTPKYYQQKTLNRKKYRKELADSYIRDQLIAKGINSKSIIPELIDTFRAILTLKRIIKNGKQKEFTT